MPTAPAPAGRWLAGVTPGRAVRGEGSGAGVALYRGMNTTRLASGALASASLLMLSIGGAPGTPDEKKPALKRMEPARDRAEDAGGGGQRRFPDSVVYLDGVPVSVLRFGELPPTLEPVWKTLASGKVVPRFRFAEYLERLGVDLARVTEVHLYGGRGRVARVKGKDLVRARETLIFSFTQQVKGKPRMHWTPGIVNDAIDGVGNIAVYVEKAPPAWDDEQWRLEIDGKPVKGVPYATGDARGGARVYLDGRLVGTIKRNMLPSGGDRALLPFLRTLGVTANIEAAELVANEKRVKRLDAAALASASFDGIPQSGGRILVYGDVSGTEASAILLRSGSEK